MPVEVTVQENEEQAVELRSLFKKRSQNTGDVNRWKDAPGLDIALLKYLGKYLDETTLKRLKKEPGAWKATVAASYFIRKAEETGNNELKDNLLQLLKDPNIKARDIGLYATRGIEGTLESENLEKILDKDTSKKTKLKPKKNAIDIVMLPISKDSYYIYAEEPKLDRKFNENLEVKIHAPCAMDSKIMKKTLKIVGSALYETYHQKCRKEKKEWRYAVKMCEVGSGVLGLIIGGIAAISTGITAIPMGFLATVGLTNIGIGLIYPMYRLEMIKPRRLKKAGKMLKKLEIRQVSWIQDTALQEIYNAAYNNKAFDKVKVTGHMTRAIKALLYRKREEQLDIDEALAHHYDTYKTIKKKETMVIKP